MIFLLIFFINMRFNIFYQTLINMRLNIIVFILNDKLYNTIYITSVSNYYPSILINLITSINNNFHFKISLSNILLKDFLNSEISLNTYEI